MKVCLLLIDSLRSDHLGCYGYPKSTSHNIDLIAKNSVVFIRAISQSNWTYPSVYSIITGRYPTTHKVSWWDQKVNEKFPTLPAILAQNGYRTGLFTPFKTLLNPKSFCKDFAERKEVKFADIPAAFADWMRRYENSFLFLHMAEYTHEPLHADKEYLKGFLEDSKDLARISTSRIIEALTSKNVMPINRKRLMRKINTRRIRLTGEELRYLIAAYDAGIFLVDKLLGQLYSIVREGGEDYIFIITSDHGQALMEHNMFGHGLSLYEELIHVPLIVDVNSGCTMKSSDPVQLIDIFPTILELLNIPVKNRFDGMSLTPIFHGSHFPDRASVSEGFPYISLAKKGYKLITKYARLNGYDLNSDSYAKSFRRSWKKKLLTRILYYMPDQLFCLIRDPHEKKNLLWKERLLYNSLMAELNQLYAQCNAESARPGDAGIDEIIMNQLRNLGYL